MSAVEENYCNLCDITYSTPAELKEHKWSLIHHVKIEQKTKNADHPCTVCYMSCTSLPEYTKHLNSEKHKNAVRTEKRVNQQKSSKKSMRPQTAAADTTSDLRSKSTNNSSSKKTLCDKSKGASERKWSSSSVSSVSSDQPSSSRRQASVDGKQRLSNQPSQQRPSHQPAQQRPSTRQTHQPPQQRPSHQPPEQRSSHQPPQSRPSHQPPQSRSSHQPPQQRPSHQPSQQRPSHQPPEQRASHQPSQQRPSHQPPEQRPSHQPPQSRPSHQPPQQRPSHQPPQSRSSHQPVPTVGDESSDFISDFDPRFDWVEAYKYSNVSGQQRRQYPEVRNREPYQDQPFGYNNSWQQNSNNSRMQWPVSNWTTFDPYDGNYFEPSFCKPRFPAPQKGLLRTRVSVCNINPCNQRFPDEQSNQSIPREQNKHNYDNYSAKKRPLMDMCISSSQKSNTSDHMNTTQEKPTSSDAKCFRNSRDSTRPYPKQSPKYERSAQSCVAGVVGYGQSPHSSRSISPSRDFLESVPMDVDSNEASHIDDNNLSKCRPFPSERGNKICKKPTQVTLNKSMDNVTYKSIGNTDHLSIECVSPTSIDNIDYKSADSVGRKSTDTIGPKSTNSIGRNSKDTVGHKSTSNVGSQSAKSIGRKTTDGIGCASTDSISVCCKSTDSIGRKSKDSADQKSGSNIRYTSTDNSSCHAKNNPKAVPKVSDRVLSKAKKTSKSVLNAGIRPDVIDQAESLVKGIREKRHLNILAKERGDTIDKPLKEIRNETTTTHLKQADLKHGTNSSIVPSTVKNPLSSISQNTHSSTALASDRLAKQKYEKSNDHNIQQRLHVAKRFSELYSKDNLAVMVNSPRSRRQRQKVSEMVRLYSKSQAAKRSIPQLNLCGIYDDAQDLSQSITLEELPSELQEQIAALLQISSDDEQIEEFSSNMQLNNSSIENMTTSSGGNAMSISIASKLNDADIESLTDQFVKVGKNGVEICTEAIVKACDPSDSSTLLVPDMPDKPSSTLYAVNSNKNPSSSISLSADHQQPSCSSSNADLMTVNLPLKDEPSDVCILSVSDYLATRMKYDSHPHDAATAATKSKTRLAGSDPGDIMMIMDDDDEEEINHHLQSKLLPSSSEARSLSTRRTSLVEIEEDGAHSALVPQKNVYSDVFQAVNRDDSSLAAVPDSTLPTAQSINMSTISGPYVTASDKQAPPKDTLLCMQASRTVISLSPSSVSDQHFSKPELPELMQISKKEPPSVPPCVPGTSQSEESSSLIEHSDSGVVLQSSSSQQGQYQSCVTSSSSQQGQYQSCAPSGSSVQLPMKKSECFKAILDLSLREEELRIEMTDVNQKIDELRTILQQYVFRKQQIINEEEEIRSKRISLLQDAVSRERTDTVMDQSSLMDRLSSSQPHSSNVLTNSLTSQAEFSQSASVSQNITQSASVSQNITQSASVSQNTDSGDSLLLGQNSERLSLSSGTNIRSDISNLQGKLLSTSIMKGLNMIAPSHMFSPGQVRLGSSLLHSPSQHGPQISSLHIDTNMTVSQSNSSAIPAGMKLEPIDLDDISDVSENELSNNIVGTKQMYLEPTLQTSTTTTTVHSIACHSSNSLTRPALNTSPSCSNLRNPKYTQVLNKNIDSPATSVAIHDKSDSLSDAIKNSHGTESHLVREADLVSNKSFSIDHCNSSDESLGYEQKRVSAHLTAVLRQSDLPQLALSETEDTFVSPSRRPPMRSVLECSKVHEASRSKLCIRKSSEELQKMDMENWKELIQQQPDKHDRTDLLLTMKKEVIDVDNIDERSHTTTRTTSALHEPNCMKIMSSLDSCLNDIKNQIDEHDRLEDDQIDEHDRLEEDSLNPSNDDKANNLLMEEDYSNSLLAVDNSNLSHVVGDVTKQTACHQVTTTRTAENSGVSDDVVMQKGLAGDKESFLQGIEEGKGPPVTNDANASFRVPDRPVTPNNASTSGKISPIKKKLRTKKQRDQLAAKTYGRLVDSSSDNNVLEEYQSPTQTKPHGKKKAQKLSPCSDKAVLSDNVCDSSTSTTMNTRQKSKKKKEKAEKSKPQRKKPVSDHSLLQAPTSSMCEVVTAAESIDLPDICAPRRGQSKRKKTTDKTVSKRSSSKLNTTLTDTDFEDPNPSPDTSTSSFIETHPISLFIGPTHSVSCVQEHEDYVYVCYGGAGAEKFDPKTCDSILKYKSGEHKTHCMVVLSLCPGEKSLVCLGGISKTLLIFSAQTGERLSSHVYGASIQCLHYNWEQLFVGMTNGAVLVCDPKRSKTICAFRCSHQSISCIASATEGTRKLICVASHDSSISVCDATTGLLMRTLDSHTKVPLSIQANGDLLYSGGTDKVLMVHNIHNGDLEWMYTDCRGVITSVIPVLTQSHNILLTASYDKLIRCYNQQTHKLMFVLYGVEKSVITTMTFSNDKVYTGNKEGEVEAMTLQLNQLWTCQCSTCTYVFGLQEHLLYHVCSDHILPNSKMSRCPWRNCTEWLMLSSSLERANEHMAGHVKNSFQPLS